MNSLFVRFRNKFLFGVVSASLMASPVSAVEDVLLTPSAKSEIISERLLLDVAKAGSRLIAVGERGHIVYSDNSGSSWEQAKVPVSTLLTAVSFPDEKNGWAVGHGGVILHSSDGGKTWSKQFDGNSANQMIIKQSEDMVASLEAQLDSASDDEVEDLEYELEDAQFALEDAEIDAEVGASKPFLDVLFVNSSEGFAIGAYGFMFKTNDGGLSWENYGSRMDNPDRFHLNAIGLIEGGALIIGGEAGVLFRSEDGGESWEMADSPYDGSYFGVIGNGEKDVAFIFGLRGNLYRSDDAGVSWEQVESNTEGTLMAAAYNSSGKLTIVGNSGTVIHSSDRGNTFEEKIRQDRLGNASVVFVENTKMLIVGESGANKTDSTGQNL